MGNSVLTSRIFEIIPLLIEAKQSRASHYSRISPLSLDQRLCHSLQEVNSEDKWNLRAPFALALSRTFKSVPSGSGVIARPCARCRSQERIDGVGSARMEGRVAPPGEGR